MPPKSKSKQKHPPPHPPSSSKHQSQQQQYQQQKQPSWPPLRPLSPPSSLTLSPQIPDQIYLINNLFPAPLCKNYVRFLSSLPLNTTPSRPKRGEAVRVNDRFQIEDAKFSEMLWSGTGLREVVLRYLEDDNDEGDNNEDEDDKDGEVPSSLSRIKRRKKNATKLFGGEPLGLNPNIRIYRYSSGQFFGKHCECYLQTN